MRALFRSSELQADFERDGYVIVPFLDAAQVAELNDHYASLDHDHKTAHGFHVSLDNTSRTFKRAVMDRLVDVTRARVDEVFDRAQVFVASYVVKEPGPRGIVPPHQDWTFVDEDQYASCTVWIALAPTTLDNGALGVIQGSHKLFDHRRASPSPHCPSPIGELMFELFPYLALKEMEPGEALIFNNRTLHGSPPNLSGVPRIAAGIGVTHAEAELRHHYLVPDSVPPQIECYRVDAEFFHQYSNGSLGRLYDAGGRPEGQACIGTEPFVRKSADVAVLAQQFIRDGNRYDAGLAAHLACLFGAVRAVASAEAAVTTPYVFAPEFPPMKPVMRDAAQQRALERDGYVVVDFLDAPKAAALAGFLQQRQPGPAIGFVCSHFAADHDFREAAYRHIRAICGERLEALTQDIRFVFASYLVKGQGDGSEVNIHQDMTVVDENAFSGFNLWCPLGGTDEHNGALHVLPGSHRLLRTLRSPTIPATYAGLRDELMPLLQPVYLRAGQAIVFDQAIIHFSPANRTQADRTVINLFFVHRDAQIVVCHYDRSESERLVELVEVGDGFWGYYDPFGPDGHARPNLGRSLGKVEYTFPVLTPELVRERYPRAEPPPPAKAGIPADSPRLGLGGWLRRVFARRATSK